MAKNKIIHLQPEEINEIEDSVYSVYKENTNSEVNVYVNQKREKPPDTLDYVMLFQAVNLALSKELTPTACKVLLYIVSLTQYGNHVGCDIKTIAEELSLSEISVKRSIKSLKERNVILSYKDPQDNRRNVYILNPHQSWKGTLMERFKVMKTKAHKQININQYKLPL